MTAIKNELFYWVVTKNCYLVVGELTFGEGIFPGG